MFFFKNKCIMANTSAIWQQAAHTVYQLQFPSCSTTAIQKSLTFNEKCMQPLAEKCQDRKSMLTMQKNKRGDKKIIKNQPARELICA